MIAPPVVPPPPNTAAIVQEVRQGLVTSFNGQVGDVTYSAAAASMGATGPAGPPGPVGATGATGPAGLSARAGTATTTSSGAISATWASPLAVNAIVTFSTPYATGQQTTCHPVSVSTTSFTAQCVTSFSVTLTNAVVALGSKVVGPVPAAAGIAVGWVATPPST